MSVYLKRFCDAPHGVGGGGVGLEHVTQEFGSCRAFWCIDQNWWYIQDFLLSRVRPVSVFLMPLATYVEVNENFPI